VDPFDKYDAEIRGCFCPLCMACASEALMHGAGSGKPKENLLKALEDGTHKHEGPHVSLTKFDPLSVRSDGSEMRYGMGVGVTLYGVAGSGHRRDRTKNL
jgi:hypothetical protein